MALSFQELLAIELVTDQVSKATAWVADEFDTNVGSDLSWRTEYGAFDSPLEAVFLIWWKALVAAERIRDGVEFSPQAAVTIDGSKYRVDFVLEPSYERKMRMHRHGRNWPNVAVELDGHDFHERTREQTTYRNQRDRALQGAGWLVLHYSGSELVRDPQTCVQDAYRKADEAFRSIERTLPFDE